MSRLARFTPSIDELIASRGYGNASMLGDMNNTVLRDVNSVNTDPLKYATDTGIFGTVAVGDDLVPEAAYLTEGYDGTLPDFNQSDSNFVGDVWDTIGGVGGLYKLGTLGLGLAQFGDAKKTARLQRDLLQQQINTNKELLGDRRADKAHVKNVFNSGNTKSLARIG